MTPTESLLHALKDHGAIISDDKFAVSEKHIDLRKTIQALEGRVTMGYHTDPMIPRGVLSETLSRVVNGVKRLNAVKPS